MEYGIDEPEREVPATEEVIMKAPPSGLALNVGRAARRSHICPLTLVLQH